MREDGWIRHGEWRLRDGRRQRYEARQGGPRSFHQHHHRGETSPNRSGCCYLHTHAWPEGKVEIGQSPPQPPRAKVPSPHAVASTPGYRPANPPRLSLSRAWNRYSRNYEKGEPPGQVSVMRPYSRRISNAGYPLVGWWKEAHVACSHVHELE
jgi:hypothetical protein